LVIEEAKTCSKLKVPLVAAGSGDPLLDDEEFKWVFIPHVGIDGHSKPFFEFLNSLDPKDRPNKIGIWIENTNVGRASGEIWRADANRYGYQIACQYTFKEQNDNAKLIKETKDNGADFVFAIFSPKQGIFAMRESKRINFNPKMFAFIRAAVSHDFAKELGLDSDYVTMAGTWGPMIKCPESREIVKRYLLEKGEYPSCDLGPFFAVAQIALNAISRAGTSDKEKIREALSLTDMTTVVGPIKFPRGFGHAEVRLVLNQWQQGILHTVWPENVASAKIIYPKPPW
jgi:branched-chain amino acid transport system substrate-binding protein